MKFESGLADTRWIREKLRGRGCGLNKEEISQQLLCVYFARRITTIRSRGKSFYVGREIRISLRPATGNILCYRDHAAGKHVSR